MMKNDRQICRGKAAKRMHDSEVDLFPESETYAVVQVVHQSGFETVEFHLKALYKGV